MAADDQTEWEHLLPEDLRKAAYKAGLESAWCRQDALRIVDILSSNGYLILGIDIWIPTDPGPTIPTPFVYDWSAEAASRTSRYPNSAAEFIRTFEWDPSDKSHRGMEPYFNVLAERLHS
jgi:hypothetical protein